MRHPPRVPRSCPCAVCRDRAGILTLICRTGTPFATRGPSSSAQMFIHHRRKSKIRLTLPLCPETHPLLRRGRPAFPYRQLLSPAAIPGNRRETRLVPRCARTHSPPLSAGRPGLRRHARALSPVSHRATARESFHRHPGAQTRLRAQRMPSRLQLQKSDTHGRRGSTTSTSGPNVSESRSCAICIGIR